jgi:hypothetical protein
MLVYMFTEFKFISNIIILNNNYVYAALKTFKFEIITLGVAAGVHFWAHSQTIQLIQI